MNTDKDKKILFILPSISLVGTRIIRLFRFQGNQKNIHIASFSKDNSNEDIKGVTYHYFDSYSKNTNIISKIRLAWTRARYIKQLNKKEDFDTIISFLKEASVPAVLSKILGASAKFIVAIRTNPAKRYRKFDSKIALFLYRFSDLVVTNSQVAAAKCRKKYALKNTETIYNPVDYRRIKELSEEKLPGKYSGIFDSDKVFINMGRLCRAKGQWHLIRAFKKVVDKDSKAKLIILGEGGLQDELEDLIKKSGLQNNVFLVGYQKNVFPFLKAADCFVFSSWYEGLPNAVLEAKAVGLPIISTDCETGPREILAPELSLEEDVQYPYISGKYTLTKPVSGKEVFKSPKEYALDPTEKMLTDMMLREVKKTSKKKDFVYDDRFDPNKVIQQWIRVL